MSRDYRYIRFFKDIRIEDIPLVGGKNASLGEMYRELMAQGVKVPNGFAVTAQAYWYVLEQAGILTSLRQALEGLQPMTWMTWPSAAGGRASSCIRLRCRRIYAKRFWKLTDYCSRNTGWDLAWPCARRQLRKIFRM